MPSLQLWMFFWEIAGFEIEALCQITLKCIQSTLFATTGSGIYLTSSYFPKSSLISDFVEMIFGRKRSPLSALISNKIRCQSRSH